MTSSAWTEFRAGMVEMAPYNPKLPAEVVEVTEVRGGYQLVVDQTIEIDGGMLPGVLYEAGLKTITDLL